MSHIETMNDNSLKKITLKQLMSLGAHFGHTKYRSGMTQYLYGRRNKFTVFDLEKTIVLLRTAVLFAQEITREHGTILFLGSPTRDQFIAEQIIASNHLYVSSKWIGGLLTNFSQVYKSIERMNKLISLGQSTSSINQSFSGLINMTEIPDMIVVFNVEDYRVAIDEAVLMNIPIVAVVDSDSEIKNIDYPIPGNNDSRELLYFIQELFIKAISKSIASLKISSS